VSGRLCRWVTGATVGLLSGGSPLRRALRQLLIGYGAAAVTYGLGLLFGAGLALDAGYLTEGHC
jgi:VIT1/CCC1 family predicted Fe2+/Mn2+ transporter